jgi:hypothetical protein
MVPELESLRVVFPAACGGVVDIAEFFCAFATRAVFTSGAAEGLPQRL